MKRRRVLLLPLLTGHWSIERLPPRESHRKPVIHLGDETERGTKILFQRKQHDGRAGSRTSGPKDGSTMLPRLLTPGASWFPEPLILGVPYNIKMMKIVQGLFVLWVGENRKIMMTVSSLTLYVPLLTNISLDFFNFVGIKQLNILNKTKIPQLKSKPDRKVPSSQALIVPTCARFR